MLIPHSTRTPTLRTDGKGNALVAVAVPSKSSWIGKNFYCNYFVYDPGANRLNLVAIPGSDAKVGRD